MYQYTTPNLTDGTNYVSKLREVLKQAELSWAKLGQGQPKLF